MGAPKGNKYAEGLTESGRPPLYSEPNIMRDKILDYFDSCQSKISEDGEILEFSKPITITGLCLFLGFESRQSFYDYEDKKEFSYIVKRARLVIENGYEEGLFFKTPTGSIFALKNMGWHDKSEHELSGNVGKTEMTDLEFEERLQKAKEALNE